MSNKDVLEAAREAFCETISLKLQQLRKVVPKGSNSELTGDFVEAMVRSFINDWISPCELYSGTMHPHDSFPLDEFKEGFRDKAHTPKQIDGIVFDSRLGPAVLKENGFIVAHPSFCRGIVETKTSVSSLRDFEDRLQGLYYQYMFKFQSITPQVMGLVIQDTDPEKHSFPDWFQVDTGVGKSPRPIFDFNTVPHCPIFVLFDNDYQPYMPAIDALIRAIFTGSLHVSRPGI